ncbi:MAG: hypothetical protein K6G89_04110 [Clostridia bacterium]|nr:hypothetical protein [Clostridia bacterium]
MFGAVIYLILITAAAGAIAVGFSLRIGHAYVPAICLTGLISAVMLTAGAALAVPYVMGALGLLCAGFIAFKIVRERRSVFYILTAEFVVFTLLAAGMILLNAGRMYYLNDEFSHWGLAVRNLFTVGKLPFAAETNALFKTYPPFCTAICYLGTCFTGSFSEAATFIPMDMLLIASLLPVVTGFMRQCAKKGCAAEGRCFAGIPAAAMIFCILCFKLSAFTSIAPDTLLGVLAFYIVWECLQAKRKIQIVAAVTAALALALVKDTGLGFVMAAAIIVSTAVIVKNSKVKSAKATVFELAECVLPLVLGAATVKLLWNYVMILANAVDGSPGLFSLLMKAIFGGFSEVQNRTTQAFFAAWINPSFSVGIPLVAVVCIFALAQLGIILLMKKLRFEGIGAAAAVFTAVSLCFFVYCFGVLASYWTVFTEGEATTVASFERYIGSYLSFWLSIIVSIAAAVFVPALVKKFRDAVKKRNTARVVLASATAAVAVLLAVFFVFLYPNKASDSAAYRANANYGEDIPELCAEAGVRHEEKILFVSSDFETRQHLIANYNAAPCTVEGLYDTPEKLLEKAGIELIYFNDTADRELIEGFLAIIDVPDAGSVEAHKLYRVKKGG